MEDKNCQEDSSGILSQLLTKAVDCEQIQTQETLEDVEQDLLHGPIPTCAKVPSFDCETEGLKYVAG